MSEVIHCDVCNCSYSAKKQYSKHLLTNKHKKNLHGYIVCKECRKAFATRYNYVRHMTSKHNIDEDNLNDEDDDNIKDIKNSHNKKDKYEKDLDLLKVVYELKHKNAILEKDCIILKLEKEKEQCEKELYKQKSEIHEKDKIFAQDIAKTTVKTTNTVVSGLTYARQNYPNAPELKKLDSYNELGENDQLIERLLFYSEKKKIADYIGDFLVKFYKKNDPNIQSLWTTDITRLTFIVRQILKKKTDWGYDKKGIKVCKIIIDPLLDNIKSILKQYINEINDIIKGKKMDDFSEDEDGYESEGDYKRHKNPPELDNNAKIKLVNSQKTAVQIITDIDNKTLAKNIVKYISPHLSLVQIKE